MSEAAWIDRLADHLADDTLVGVLTQAFGNSTGQRPTPRTLATALLRALPSDVPPVGPGRDQLIRAVEATRPPEDMTADWGAMFEYVVEAAHRLGYQHVTPAVLLGCLAGYPGFHLPAELQLQDHLSRGGVNPIVHSPVPSDAECRYPGLGYGVDLSRKMVAVRECPVIGRDQEIDQMVEVLLGGQNPILTGEAGVGKSALVEGLAWRLARPAGQLLAKALPCRVVAVQVGDLIAGTGQQGALEKRLREFIDHLAAVGDVVPFIDEVHSLLAGGAASRVIVEELKPALASGKIRVIGATTEREYQRYFLSDPALRRRFSDVRVKEPNAEQTEEILTRLGDRVLPPGVRGRGVVVGPGTAAAAVKVAQAHFKDDRLPARPIKLIQRAAAARLRALAEGRTDSGQIEPRDVYAVAAQELGVDEKVLHGGAAAQLARLVLNQA